MRSLYFPRKFSFFRRRGEFVCVSVCLCDMGGVLCVKLRLHLRVHLTTRAYWMIQYDY